MTGAELLEQRYRRHRSSQAYDLEKRGGMKRVDFLMGKTKFLGWVRRVAALYSVLSTGNNYNIQKAEPNKV